MNGMSGIGTTNASSRAWYQLSVRRAGNRIETIRSVQLGRHQKYSYTSHGIAFTDKRGVISVSPGYYHTPWFNS